MTALWIVVALQGIGLLLLTAEQILRRRSYFQLGLIVGDICRILGRPAKKLPERVRPGLIIRRRAAS